MISPLYWYYTHLSEAGWLKPSQFTRLFLLLKVPVGCALLSCYTSLLECWRIMRPDGDLMSRVQIVAAFSPP